MWPTCHDKHQHDIQCKMGTSHWFWQPYIEYELIVPFQFHMKISTHVISQKTICKWGFSFKQITIFTKKNCWKFTFIWKRKRIMLEAFVSKSISHVYQNISEILKNWPQTIQTILLKNSFSCIKWFPHIVLSP